MPLSSKAGLLERRKTVIHGVNVVVFQQQSQHRLSLAVHWLDDQLMEHATSAVAVLDEQFHHRLTEIAHGHQHERGLAADLDAHRMADVETVGNEAAEYLSLIVHDETPEDGLMIEPPAGVAVFGYACIEWHDEELGEVTVYFEKA